MKRIYLLLRSVVTAIALLVFAAGVSVALVGVYEFILAFSQIGSSDRHHVAGLVATGLLKGVDMFLMAMVFFVFSIGVLILFHHPEKEYPVRLPEWLKIKSFVELKVILWEAILTTLVVSYLVGLAEAKFAGERISLSNLILPGVIFLISLSLFFLKKKGDH